MAKENLNLMRFIRERDGRYAVAPGGVGGQCVDLANLWLVEALGLPQVLADAVDWPAAAPRGLWRFEHNSPQAVPPSGALVIWQPNSVAAGTGPAGHIAIATPLADPLDLVTFDQDWPWGSAPRLVLHRDYLGVAGWLVPRR